MIRINRQSRIVRTGTPGPIIFFHLDGARTKIVCKQLRSLQVPFISYLNVSAGGKMPPAATTGRFDQPDRPTRHRTLQMRPSAIHLSPRNSPRSTASSTATRPPPLPRIPTNYPWYPPSIDDPPPPKKSHFVSRQDPPVTAGFSSSPYCNNLGRPPAPATRAPPSTGHHTAPHTDVSSTTPRVARWTSETPQAAAQLIPSSFPSPPAPSPPSPPTHPRHGLPTPAPRAHPLLAHRIRRVPPPASLDHLLRRHSSPCRPPPHQPRRLA